MAGPDDKPLTEEEKELYDRQIRLWGYDSQKRLREGKVLVIGMGGLGAEIVKNLVLSGLHTVTLMDSEKPSENDRRTQFLIPFDNMEGNRAELSVSRAHALNPLVKVSSERIEVLKENPDYIKEFHTVIATGLSLKQAIELDTKCHENKVKFYACNVVGLFGYALIDIGQHEYIDEILIRVPRESSDNGPRKYEDIVRTNKKEISFPPLKDVLNYELSTCNSTLKIIKTDPCYFVIKALMTFRDQKGRDPLPSENDDDLKYLRSICERLVSVCSFPMEKINDELLNSLFLNVNVGCAIMGGVIAQEVIKVISNRSAPLKNVVFFDPIRSAVGAVFLDS